MNPVVWNSRLVHASVVEAADQKPVNAFIRNRRSSVKFASSLVVSTRRVLWFTAFCVLSSAAHAEIFKGIDFPSGISSFADAVVNYSPGIAGSVPSVGNRDPSHALGAPDVVGIGGACVSALNCHAVTLGDGGSITLRFTDNFLTAGNSPAIDLWIFEVYGDVEATSVDISPDGINWFSVGKVPGSTSGVDLDAFGLGSTSRFSYVRLTDDSNQGGQTGPTVGADIDAIGAASSVTVPEPQTYAMIGGGLLMLMGIARRRFV
jgi:hypothetical protein